MAQTQAAIQAIGSSDGIELAIAHFKEEPTRGRAERAINEESGWRSGRPTRCPVDTQGGPTRSELDVAKALRETIVKNSIEFV